MLKIVCFCLCYVTSNSITTIERHYFVWSESYIDATVFVDLKDISNIFRSNKTSKEREGETATEMLGSSPFATDCERKAWKRGCDIPIAF